MSNLRPDFHEELAKQFFEDIQYRKANYYYFLGKIIPWNEGDEVVPPTPVDSFLEDSKVRDQIIFTKKILPSEISLACTNFTWESGTIYTKWDHTKVMKGEPFYVMTDEFKVYKCLDNAGGEPSTVKPVGNSIEPLRTVDGYLWKYMYTIPSFKRNKFISLPHIPVQRALSDTFYNRGSVESISVIEPGSGYTDQLLTTIQVSGTTTGSGGSFSFTLGPVGNFTNITVLNGGSGYTKGVRIVVNTSSGTGAVLEPVVVAGVITDVTIIDGGVGYQVSDTLTPFVGGAILVPKVSRITGSIEGVVIIDPGIGYIAPPVLTVVGAGGLGTGLYEGNTAAILDAIEDQGSIVRVTISDPGQNYPADTDTTILVTGDGENAVFTPVIYNTEIVDVIVENAGEGYTTINLTVIGNGSGAILQGNILQSDYISDQSIIEQTTVAGAIHAIEVTEGGFLYSPETQVIITGDGTGCTAEPIFDNQSIKAVKVTNAGSGYTYANISFVDSFGSGYGAAAYAILPPTGGHGKDAVKELYADTVSINSNLRSSAITQEVVQDFRQYGIIKNPRNLFSNRLFKELETLVCFKLNFQSVVGLEKDEILIFNDQYRYSVAEISGNTVYLQQLFDKSISPLGVFKAEADPNREYQSNAILYVPSYNKYTGSLLYVSNERSFSFSEEQGIIVKTFIKF